MDRAAVIGAPGSAAAKVARQLADLMKVQEYTAFADDEAQDRAPGVVLTHSAEAMPEGIPLIVFIDDAPLRKGSRDEGREAALARLAGAQTAGNAAIILEDSAAAKRWMRHLRDEGLPSPRPLRRVFVAAALSPGCDSLVSALEGTLGLAARHPDREGDVLSEGWGRVYASAAEGERWLVQSASWHAVEYLIPRADAVIHLPGTVEPRTAPERRTWRFMFGAWFARYPRIEAGLLSRNLSGLSHLTAIYTVRNEFELAAVIAGFSGAAAPAAPAT